MSMCGKDVSDQANVYAKYSMRPIISYSIQIQEHQVFTVDPIVLS